MRRLFDKSFILYLVLSLLLTSCGDDEPAVTSIDLIGGTINGSSVFEGSNQNVETDVVLTLTFSGALNTEAFEQGLEIFTDDGGVNFTTQYQNSGSRAVISMSLDTETTYQVLLSGAIGTNGEVLSQPIDFSFRTSNGGLLTETDPCTTTSTACLQTLTLQKEGNTGNLDFYANYPIYTENARWDKLKYAIIVVHGFNRNADDYFAWVGSAIRSAGLEENTVLLSPKFKVESEASGDDLFWSSTGWREARDSQSDAAISSFEVIDSLVSQLSTESLFPVMEKIIVTGHSSGGLFTHVYAASNRVDQDSNIDFDYVIANSQYFYYPDGQRVDENTGQLTTPSSCTGYTIWPLGYNSVPSYVGATQESALNNQYINRSIYYFLGNGSGSDPSFNDSDCNATLLGSTRFNRGENVFEYLNQKFPSNNHAKRVVEGVGHDGQAMYASNEFQQLLLELLGN